MKGDPPLAQQAPPSRILLLIALVLIVWALSGCSGSPILRTEVTSFHQLEIERLRAAGLVLRPTAEQRGSLEFELYATELARQFARLGVSVQSEVADPQAGRPVGTARFGLTVQYGSRLERVRHVDYPTYPLLGHPFFTPSIGVVRVGPGGTVLRPDPIFWEPTLPMVYLIDQSLHELRLQIDDLTAEPGHSRVFELRAEALSSSLSLPQVMPALIAASLEGFPAPSGSTRRRSVPIDEPQVNRRQGPVYRH